MADRQRSNRQAADKRLPDRHRQRPDRRWTAEVRQQKAGGAGLFIGSRRQPLHSRQIIPDMFGLSPYMALTAKKTGAYSNIEINQSVSMPQSPNGR
ncbi:hypothetical protein CE91St46_08150 [Eubacteriales bacterium]|nr:hypothetical protein CE91St46_08150 [Eubacteriales bacterium]GKH62346.1 hypothetical protein CE91St47_08150 [Eubacteriales bacterium]